MKRRLIIAAAVLLAIPAAAQERATVLFTKNITPESLVSITARWALRPRAAWP